jgi:RNA polymerase sigma-70 factor (ECF subfamily)
LDGGFIRRTSVDLLRRAQDGDTEALDRLIQRYLPALRRWASGRLPRYARERLDTDDLIQETVLAVLPYVHSFEPRGDGALQAYMRKVLLNRIRREIRRAQRVPRRVTLGTDRPAPMESPLDEAIGKEAVARYEAALRRLRAEDREAIIARVELHCSFEQLAEMLGKPSADAARMAASRALLQLAKEMDRGT